MSAIVPLYNGEAAPKALRGFLLVMYQVRLAFLFFPRPLRADQSPRLAQVQIITGIFFSYILDIAVHHINTSVAWRLPIGLQFVLEFYLFTRDRSLIRFL